MKKTFKTIKEVAQAVAKGADVRWSNDNYHVVKDGLDQFFITYRPGTREANSVGLYWQDGVTSDYNPDSFYIMEPLAPELRKSLWKAIYRDTHKDFKGNIDGVQSIMSWAEFGGKLVTLETITDEELWKRAP